MTTYNELKKIIPADQALANKGLQAGLEQIKNIFDATLPGLAGATINLESNLGLDAINALTQPLPANVVAYFTQTYATGSGEDGLLLLTDLMGTAAGVENPEFESTIAVLNSFTSTGVLDPLIGSQQVYATMQTAASGVWTVQTQVEIPNVQPNVFTTTIPAGWTGTGVYDAENANQSIQLAFNTALTPAFQSAVDVIIATNPANCAVLNSNWTNIANQIVTEQNNIDLSGIDLANLVPNLQPWGLVYNLPSNGLDVVEGGSAFVLQSVANTATQGGQAMISTMREARNQQLLNAAGMQTDILISDQYPEPAADLGTAQYTVSQAVSQKII